MRAGAVLVVGLQLIVGCSSVAPTISPATATLAAATNAPTTPGTPAPTPSPLAFPTTSEVELMPGRYSSSPPFDIEFTFEIPGPGWFSAHIHGEFFDVMRFEGTDQRSPIRWIAWAHPETIHGDREAPAADLTPQEAATQMAMQIAVEAGTSSRFTFAGLDGVQMDYHTEIRQVPLFGGPDGDFQLDNSQDARIGIVKIDEEMLLIMCLAPPGQLEAGCADAQPILDSVEL
jgi:hypothetical protein